MSLTDTLGSLAVASRGQYMTGVSTDISTSFVKPAGKPGDELKVTATLTAMGAFTHVHRPAYTPPPRPSPAPSSSQWTRRGAYLFVLFLF